MWCTTCQLRSTTIILYILHMCMRAVMYYSYNNTLLPNHKGCIAIIQSDYMLRQGKAAGLTSQMTVQHTGRTGNNSSCDVDFMTVR